MVVNIFLISSQKYMLWVFIRSAPLRHFCSVPTNEFSYLLFVEKYENVSTFSCDSDHLESLVEGVSSYNVLVIIFLSSSQIYMLWVLI